MSLKFRLVRLVGAENETAFIYDEAARQLLIKDVNRFDRATFRQWCETERWFLPNKVIARRSIAPVYLSSPSDARAHARSISGKLLEPGGYHLGCDTHYSQKP